MSSSPSQDWVSRIGATAGAVWRTLDTNGPMSVAKLIRAVGEPRETVLLALGWLAREDKITSTERGRSREIALR